ncbi:MAG: response regulator transcription factor [Oscillospiraceae bacterium]|nr:response regulator transcription factor [Oscillospiraceae bacterium]MBQ9981683.1 response regulator transcription factor [Oscillospiraceae bacterium]
MRLALCDDDEIFLHNFKKYILGFEDVSIESFLSGKNFLENFSHEIYDGVILDIDMPDMNGFDTASQINAVFPDTPIIFLTCHEHLVFESFKFRPFDFVRKNRFQDELPEIIMRLKKTLLLKRPSKISIVSGQSIYSVRYNDIYYVESVHNKLCIFGKDKIIITITSTMKDFINKLPDCFFRVHSGFIVNMEYVSQIKVNQIVLTNDVTIPLSRSKTKKFKEAFQQFSFGRWTL